jgi:uncharacterized protein
MSSATASRIKTPVTPQLRPGPAIPPIDFAVSALRTALSAIDSASAVPVESTPSAGSGGPISPAPYPASVSGGGTAHLTEPEVEQIVRTEVAERQAAAYSYDQAGRPDQAERLRREASVLMSVIDRSEAP